MLRTLGILLVVVVLIAGVLVLRIMNAAGAFDEVKPHFAGTCKAVPGVVGAEDIELDRATGNVFISSQDRRREKPDSPLKQGGLFLAHIDKPDVPPTPLTAELSRTFHPHGISLFADATGRKTLAVVDHPEPASSQVLLFDVTEEAGAVKLALRRTVNEPIMQQLNDVTLVSHEAFYVTNDHGSETELGGELETWLLLPRANVVYFDGTVAKVAATGFRYANGINRNADASEIYVAEATGRTLSTLRRDATTGELVLVHSLAIPMGLDNIDVDSDGALWIGAHPKMLDFLAHAQDEKKHSPSAVLKVVPAGDSTTYEEIYVNAGEEMSGSSVAVRHGNTLLIGAVFDPKYLSCTLP